MILGVVLLPQDQSRREFGIQLVRQDAYSKEEVKKLHDLVKSKIEVEEGTTARAFYMPTFEQHEAADRDRAWLEQNDVIVGSTDRWLLGDACYAPGWAFGKAKFVPGAEIKQALLDGRLTYQDILVTDGVPAEVPYVAGIVSLAPSTPSSHVAILAKTWGIPFVFPKDEEAHPRARRQGDRRSREDDLGRARELHARRHRAARDARRAHPRGTRQSPALR